MNVANLIRLITFRSTTEGVEQSKAALKGLQQAYDGVAKSAETSATVSEQAARKQLSIAAAVERQRRALDMTYAATKQYERAQRDLDRGLAQGVLTQTQHSNLLALAAQRFNQVSRSQQAFATVTQDLNARVSASAGSLGVLGSAMSALGPIGIGVAAAFGGIVLALNAASNAAHALAQKAIELRQFSEATGLSAQQVQALRQEAAKFTLTGEEAQNVIQQFTRRFHDLRDGEGELYKQVRRVNPEIAKQMQETTDAAEALTLFGKALQQVNNIFDRNALVSAGTGRGGLRAANFLTGLDVGAVTAKAAGRELSKDVIDELSQLEIEIQKSTSKMAENIAKIFALPVLRAERDFAVGMREITEELAKDPSAKLMEFINAIPTVVKFIPGLGNAIQAVQSVGNLATSPAEAAGPLRVTVRPGASVGPGLGGAAAASISPRTPQAVLAELKGTIDAMGTAATAEMRLNAARQQAAIALKDKVLTEEQYKRTLASLDLDHVTAMEGRRLALLGDLASAQDVELQKAREINRARMDGVNISKEEEATLRERARLAQEYSKLPNQIAFERAQIGRSDIDATVAQRLRGANMPIDLNSAVAQQIRFNEQLKITKDLVTDFATGFSRDFVGAIREGASAWDAFHKAGLSAINRLADRLLDIAVQGLVAKAFGGLVGGTGGGILGSLFGVKAAVAHDGGIMGQTTAHRFIHPAYFDDAPRYHSGGIAGLQPDEVPAILRRGEPVFRDMNHARQAVGGGEKTININSTYNIDGAVSKDDIAQAIRASHKAAVRDAVALASTAVPARMSKYNQLGT